MKWINAEQQVTVTIYDDEREEHINKKMTVEEVLDTYANEGCPAIYSDPERKPGKWEYIQYDGNPKIGNWHCSNCRLIVNLGFEGKPYYDYCPGCGAKMEEEG